MATRPARVAGLYKAADVTFHRIDNRIMRLVDGLTHVVLGYQDMGQYLRWCGGYMAPMNRDVERFATCFFCLLQVKR